MYYLIYIPLYCLSLLPWRVIYLLSDTAYAIIYYVIGYRKKVVMDSLQIAFPDKTENERIIIAKAFYHNFTDTFIETIKLLSISDQEAANRFLGDMSGMEAAYTSGKNIQIHAPHNFNWEIIQWGVVRAAKYSFIGVYMPISNKVLNKIFIDLRSRFGTILIPANHFKSSFADWDKKNKYILALAADQNPGSPLSAYWLNFFGKPTAFVTGPEKGARSCDTAVVFAKFFKVKRGYYKVEFKLITDQPEILPEGELTRLFAAHVEDTIRSNPANYLWSHRRWKHEWNEDYRERWIG